MHGTIADSVCRRGERGATHLECATLLALVAVVVLASVGYVGEATSRSFARAESALDSAKLVDGGGTVGTSVDESE